MTFLQHHLMILFNSSEENTTMDFFLRLHIQRLLLEVP